MADDDVIAKIPPRHNNTVQVVGGRDDGKWFSTNFNEWQNDCVLRSKGFTSRSHQIR